MTAVEFAEKNGFRGAKLIRPWRGYDCYEAIYTGEGLNDTPAIGYPQIILCKDGVFRMATADETLQYMEFTLRGSEE